MDDLADLYRHKLNLPNAVFTCIDHEDAMVAAVFKISQPGSHDMILKVCSRKGDFLRESYFLSRFSGKIPVPKVIHLIEPKAGMGAAVLMEKYGALSTGRPEGEDSLRMISAHWSSESGLRTIKAPS